MDRSSAIVIHAAVGLSNQRLYAKHLHYGFSRLGYKVSVCSDKSIFGDINVCIGPHFAFSECLGKNTIYVDRCLWGDDLEYVTIGWLNDDGGMRYPLGCDSSRPKPDLKAWVSVDSGKVLYLFDWGLYPKEYKLADKIYPNLSMRPHPATGKSQPALADDLKGCKLVIGHRTSALFTAVVGGYPVVCLDSRASVYPVAGHDILQITKPCRKQWLNNMSYAQWSGSEIASGEALEYVINHKQLPNS